MKHALLSLFVCLCFLSGAQEPKTDSLYGSWKIVGDVQKEDDGFDVIFTYVCLTPTHDSEIYSNQRQASEFEGFVKSPKKEFDFIMTLGLAPFGIKVIEEGKKISLTALFKNDKGEYQVVDKSIAREFTKTQEDDLPKDVLSLLMQYKPKK